MNIVLNYMDTRIGEFGSTVEVLFRNVDNFCIIVDDLDSPNFTVEFTPCTMFSDEITVTFVGYRPTWYEANHSHRLMNA